VHWGSEQQEELWHQETYHTCLASVQQDITEDGVSSGHYVETTANIFCQDAIVLAVGGSE